MEIYLAQARSLASRAREPWDTFTPPGFPAFLALVGARSAGDLGLLAAAHAALGGATAALSAVLAGRLARARLAAVLAGLLVAAYPPLVFYAGVVLSETLFAFLLVAFVVLGDRAFERPRAAWVVASGAVLGAAIVVRPSLLTLLPVLAWLAVRGSPTTRRTVRRVLAVALLAIAPLALANTVLLGRPALVATNGGVNFFLSHATCRSVRTTAPGPIVEISTHYTRTHFDETCTRDAPFIDERAYYRAGLEEIGRHPSRLLRAFDGVREGLGITAVRPWPHQPFWPGSMELSDELWRWSRAYTGVILVPAIAFAIHALRRERDAARRAAVAIAVGVLASVVAALYLFNGNPRVRVSSDPVAIALAAAGLHAFVVAVARRVRRATA